MTRIKHYRVAAWLTSFSLMVSLGSGILVTDRASAQSAPGVSQGPNQSARANQATYPELARYATDLTALARAGRLEPVMGHNAEISRTVRILSLDIHNNPVLIGESGPGVAEIAQGLAQRIATGEVPESLRDKRLFSLSLDALVAQAKDSSEFTTRLQAVLAEVESADGQVILFVDQLHQFVGTYAAPIATDAVRTALGQSRLRIVGATTSTAYAEYIAGDTSIAGLFQPVQVSDGTGNADSTGDQKTDDSNEESDGNEKSDSNDKQFKGDKLSPDLREMIQNAGSHADRVSLIVQADDLSKLGTLLKNNGVRVDSRFPRLGAVKIEAPLGILEKLAASGNTRYLSLDRRVQSMGHVTATTGADLVRNQTTTTTTTSSLGVSTTNTSNITLDGTGIGVAILDSGMDAGHKAFLGKDDHSRIVVSQDFTGENRVDDPYGHGTHVASIAAGNGRIADGAYTGIASNANIINLRVLNSLGMGNVSSTLAALDWVMTNRTAYNIRVVNMSLGTAAVDSYNNDPICRAVRRLVDAGVVVVAAAGNNGKNSAGQKVYGQIHCPGNEPSAITVGAANTYGTNARNDDTIATFSSRGPTRSFWTDAAGVKHYDNLIKPDLVAPGNKIIDAESDHNLLVTEHPQLDAGVSLMENRKQMFLSGTSMSTPMVAGAAAMLLQANPTLTPNMVKAFFMYTAQPLQGFNTFEQGAGELNIEGAMRVARLVRKDFGTSKPVGAPLLTSLIPPVPTTTIGGNTFTWSQGILLGKHFAKGIGLIKKYQPVYALGIIVSDSVSVSDGIIVSDSDGIIVSDGVTVSDGIVVSDGIIVSDDGIIVSDGIIISDGITMSDGALFCSMGIVVSDSDGIIVSDGIVVSDSDGIIVSDSDGIIVSDAYVLAQSAMLGGELTDSCPVVVDDGVDYIED